MFVILVYDVKQKRVSVVHKICKKYLHPIQNSVFEGDITRKKLKDLQNELMRRIDIEYDAVCIYITSGEQHISKAQIGVHKDYGNII